MNTIINGNLLFIGDPHFKTDNIIESEKLILEIERYLNSYTIQYVIVLGDILHTHEKLNTFAMNNSMKLFTMLSKRITTYVLVGNHDAVNNSIFLTTDHWLNVLKGWYNIIVVDKPIKISLSLNNIVKTICICPYVSDGRFVEALNHIDNWTNSNLIIGHQLLDGAKMGPIVASGVEEWKLTYPLLISGHIHDKQRPQPNLFYCGSSLQHAFGESGDKTLYLYNIFSNTGEELKLNIPYKDILYVDVSNIDSIQEQMKKYKDDNVSVKIVIKGDESLCKSSKGLEIISQIQSNSQVKSIVFKPTFKISNEFSYKEESFELILKNIVTNKNDPLLDNLLNHLLIGGEDLSDKDVFFI